jgi:hypothetical protein
MALHQLYHRRLIEASNGLLRNLRRYISAVSPVDGVTEAMPVNRRIASACSFLQLSVHETSDCSWSGLWWIAVVTG